MGRLRGPIYQTDYPKKRGPRFAGSPFRGMVPVACPQLRFHPDRPCRSLDGVELSDGGGAGRIVGGCWYEHAIRLQSACRLGGTRFYLHLL